MTQREKEMLLSQLTILINGLGTDDESVTTSVVKHANEKVELLTIKEGARLIDGLTECTLRCLIKQGKIPSIRSGTGKRGKILVSKTALLEYFGG